MAELSRELQETVIKARYIEEQVNLVQRQLFALNEALVEVDNAKYSIEQLQKAGKETEVMFPLGSGAYVPGKVSAPQTLPVDVGSGVVIEKDPKEAIDFLNLREAEIKKTITTYENIIANYERDYLELNSKARELSKK